MKDTMNKAINGTLDKAMNDDTSNIAVVTKYLLDKEWSMGCGGDRGERSMSRVLWNK